MSFIRALLTPERRSTGISRKELEDALSGRDTGSIGKDSMLTLTAVYRAIGLLATSAATIPLRVIERTPEGAKIPASSHPLYGILHDKPNPYQTAVQFREGLLVDTLIHGNGYAEIEYGRDGQVKALWPLVSRRVKLEIDWNRPDPLRYRVNMIDTTPVYLRFEQVLHVKGMGDGFRGVSPLEMFRRSLAVGVAAEQFGESFFTQGANPKVAITHPGVLGDETYDRLSKQLASTWGGMSNAHRAVLLEEGMKAERIQLAPEEAQFIQTRRLTVAEVARIYGVPPHMLADLEKATYSNVEHQGIEFVTHGLRPWLVRLESEINNRLFLPRDRQRFFAEHVVEGLLRGDTVQRFSAYATARQWGWMSVNDILKLENQSPIAGGDIYLSPLNMVPSEAYAGGGIPSLDERAQPKQIESRAEQSLDKLQRRKIQTSMRSALHDVYRRIIAREIGDLRKKMGTLKEDKPSFRQWLDEWREEMQTWSQKRLEPVYRTYSDLITEAAKGEIDYGGDLPSSLRDEIEAYIEAAASRQARVTQRMVLGYIDEAQEAGLTPEELATSVEESISGWSTTRVDAVTEDERVRAGQAFALMAFAAMGVSRMKWRTSGSETCPTCSSMNGKTVGTGTAFVREGGMVGEMKINTTIKHPPLHQGCDCSIVPE